MAPWKDRWAPASGWNLVWNRCTEKEPNNIHDRKDMKLGTLKVWDRVPWCSFFFSGQFCFKIMGFSLILGTPTWPTALPTQRSPTARERLFQPLVISAPRGTRLPLLRTVFFTGIDPLYGSDEKQEDDHVHCFQLDVRITYVRDVQSRTLGILAKVRNMPNSSDVLLWDPRMARTVPPTTPTKRVETSSKRPTWYKPLVEWSDFIDHRLYIIDHRP